MGWDDATQALEKIAQAPVDRPFVVAQLGQSLDGRIALPNGESKYISGPAALDHLHRLRAHVDAVVVGAGTVAADNPQLNVRRCAGANPARVVIDPKGRLPQTDAWLRSDGARRILVTAVDGPQGAACARLTLPARAGHIAPADIVAALFALGLRRLLIEGGAQTVSHFIAAGCVDRLHLIQSCVILGSGKSGLQLPEIDHLSKALRPNADIYPLGGGDLLFDCDLAPHTLHAKGARDG